MIAAKGKSQTNIKKDESAYKNESTPSMSRSRVGDKKTHNRCQVEIFRGSLSKTNKVAKTSRVSEDLGHTRKRVGSGVQ